MKENLVDINVVLDRSGSMSCIAADTIGGFNEFLKTQQEADGEAFITLAQFDDIYEVVYSGKNIKEAPMLSSLTFKPRGSTALLDAIGKTINTTGERLANLNEDQRPEKIIFVILTDGGENASREFTNTQINDMIKHQTDVYSWDFIFIGANQDAIQVGATMGFNMGNSMTYAANSVGTTCAFTSMSEKMTLYRSGSLGESGKLGASGATGFFDANDRSKQAEAGA
jgi:hypothetical protein